MPRRKGLTIGAVLSTLREQFPDLTISKIRFLESQGLLNPARTPSGYRTYSAADVERLRYILSAQRDRFWPLKVIREALDALERGLEPAEAEGSGRPVPPRVVEDPDVPQASALAAPSQLRLTESELVTSAGLDEQTWTALQTFGLVRPDHAGHFDDDDLAVATAAAALAAYGVEPRHLRSFRTAADREVGLVQQIVIPARAAGRRSAERVDPTADVLHHCLALHAALVRSALRH